MDLQNWQYKLCSQHALMANYVHFNNSGSMFVTCGQDGEVHVYTLLKNRQIQHLGFANLFLQSIVSVSWASPAAGSRLAVGGSKGTLSILHIDNKNGQIVKQKSFSLGRSTPISLDWHPSSKKLICGTLDGKCLKINQVKYDWQIKKIVQIKSDSPAQVAWTCSQDPIQLIGCDSILYRLIKTQDKLGSTAITNQIDKLFQFSHDSIKRILVRQEGASQSEQIIVLTNKQIKICELKEEKLSIRQSLNNVTLNINNLNWGWNQSELVCYSCRKLPEKGNAQKQGGDVPINHPILISRSINGDWTPSV